MKKLLFFALATLTLTSCKKQIIERRASSAGTTTQSYTALTIVPANQLVKVSVNGNQLNMVYNEDITLLLDTNALAKSYAVHLKEDLTATQLSAYDYHSITKWGINATNWVDDNLNNVVIKSSKDTLINNRVFVKKCFVRSFVYQQGYNNAAAATTAMNALLKQADIITFSAYYAPLNPDVATTVKTAKLVYVKL